MLTLCFLAAVEIKPLTLWACQSVAILETFDKVGCRRPPAPFGVAKCEECPRLLDRFMSRPPNVPGD
jgi:hypothetical protein